MGFGSFFRFIWFPKLNNPIWYNARRLLIPILFIPARNIFQHSQITFYRIIPRIVFVWNGTQEYGSWANFIIYACIHTFAIPESLMNMKWWEAIIINVYINFNSSICVYTMLHICFSGFRIIPFSSNL